MANKKPVKKPKAQSSTDPSQPPAGPGNPPPGNP